MKAIRVGNTLTVIFSPNEIYSTNQLNDSQIGELMLLFMKGELTDKEKQAVLEIIAPEFMAKKEKIEEAKEQVKIVEKLVNEGSSIFEVVNGSMQMKGIPLSIPKTLADRIKKVIEKKDTEQLEALTNFWTLAALNPDPVAREDIFSFLSKYKFPITPTGYFVAYRRVLTTNGKAVKPKNEELSKFIQGEHVRIKSQKKGPNSFFVFETNDGYVAVHKDSAKANELQIDGTSKLLGTLGEMYENLNENEETAQIFTDAHTGTFQIKIGEPVWQDRKKCNPDPHSSCSRGLHVGTPTFVGTGYSFGDVQIAVLINPMNVVAVPKHDAEKMRVCEYLPIGIVQDKDGKLDEIDVELYEEQYTKHTIEQIQKMIESAKFTELKKHSLIPEELNIEVYKNVVVNLESANSAIAKRVEKV